MSAKQRGNTLEGQARAERRVRLPGSTDKLVSYRNVNTGVLIETLQTVAIAGGAIRFGFTRDGGAFAFGIYGDGDPYTVYCSPKENVDDVLRSIREGFDIIGNSAPSRSNGASGG